MSTKNNQIAVSKKATWGEVFQWGWAATKSVTTASSMAVRIGNDAVKEQAISGFQKLDALAVEKNNQWCEKYGYDRQIEAPVRVAKQETPQENEQQPVKESASASTEKPSRLDPQDLATIVAAVLAAHQKA